MKEDLYWRIHSVTIYLLHGAVAWRHLLTSMCILMAKVCTICTHPILSIYSNAINLQAAVWCILYTYYHSMLSCYFTEMHIQVRLNFMYKDWPPLISFYCQVVIILNFVRINIYVMNSSFISNATCFSCLDSWFFTRGLSLNAYSTFVLRHLLNSDQMNKPLL